ncbi:hypothetical protein [Pinibacter aurantiacus]|uniref:Lipoprotein n=1 Tax=Pinibacter aurantiacus TaxID=2851599 RepID=A0A9E2SCE8_9BACT|nr:hypothetical protein [Pinibacter aurantiacus]MBV4360518.1 hypothetical protein [Pinibacter aurantiacus]
MNKNKGIHDRYRNIIFITLPFVLFFLFSCASFDKEFYERVTNIKFPKAIKIIETYDNGEFYTCSSFKIDSFALRKFISDYKFEPLKRIYPSQFLGVHSLKKELPDFNNFDNKFFVTGTKGKNSWIYIIDLNKCILWAEVQYPDMAGN